MNNIARKTRILYPALEGRYNSWLGYLLILLRERAEFSFIPLLLRRDHCAGGGKLRSFRQVWRIEMAMGHNTPWK